MAGVTTHPFYVSCSMLLKRLGHSLELIVIRCLVGVDIYRHCEL